MFTEEDVYKSFKFYNHLKDKTPRPGQIEAATYAVNSELSVVVIRGDTGCGKSAVGATIIKTLVYGNYLVNTKSLQDQITRDFVEGESLYGRANYDCIFTGKMENGEYVYQRTVADCFKSLREKCDVKNECLYTVQKIKTAGNFLRILNYPYFLHETNFTGKKSMFAGVPIVVCDEADTLEDTLLNFIKVTISEKQIRELNVKPPKYKTSTAKHGISSWKDWARNYIEKIKRHINKLDVNKEMRKIERYESLLYKLYNFIELVDETWIYDEGKRRFGREWTFSPTWITPEMTDKFFRNHGMKFVLMSATLPSLPALSLQLGIPLNEMDYYEMPTLFNTRNKPIYVRPIIDISSKNSDENFPLIVEEIKHIMNEHKKYKGLIHTSSYKLTKMVMDIGDNRLITHNTTNKMNILEKFKKSSEPLVLVSPSMERGISLDDDHARFIIISKAPFPDLSNKQTSVRLYSSLAGRYWYRAITAQTIEQQAGRGVRNENDWCHIYLLDSNIKNLIVKSQSLFSNHFKECLIWEYAGRRTVTV